MLLKGLASVFNRNGWEQREDGGQEKPARRRPGGVFQESPWWCRRFKPAFASLSAGSLAGFFSCSVELEEMLRVGAPTHGDQGFLLVGLPVHELL